MLRKHSSDSDYVPLDSYKAHKSLHKPDSMACEFCDHISTTIYENFEHNATHIVIPLVNLTLHKCEDCLHHFTSIEELTTHVKFKHHRTSQVHLKSDCDIILQSIIKKQLVVKCHDLFNDIKPSRISLNDSSDVSKRTIISESDDTDVSKKPTISESDGTNVSKRTISTGNDSKDVSKETTNTKMDSSVSKTKNISNNVVVKSELPTYIISDSDSNGRNSPSDTVGQGIKREQRCTKEEVFQTKPEHITQNLQGTVNENLIDGNGEQSTLHKSESPAHPKWQDPSDSESDFDPYINEDSKMKFYYSDEEIEEVDQSVFEYTTADNSSAKLKSSPDYEPIRSRLMFEDDVEDNFVEEILPDIPCRAVPNMRLIGKTPNTNSKLNPIIPGRPTNWLAAKDTFTGNGDAANEKISDTRVEETLEEYPESVPYETLMETLICDCRYCGRCFCNRMQLISHETTHLRIRKPRPSLCPYCERFYPGNFRSLRKHIKAKHPKIDPNRRRPQAHLCKICHLSYYRYSRHALYYHSKPKEEKTVPILRKFKTFKLCDLCLKWCKNGDIYKMLGSHSKNGKTQKCAKCHNRHFTINLVTRKPVYNNFTFNHNNRSMSNEERLRRIKNKLKRIKLLNKCFCCSFI